MYEIFIYHIQAQYGHRTKVAKPHMLTPSEKSRPPEYKRFRVPGVNQAKKLLDVTPLAISACCSDVAFLDPIMIDTVFQRRPFFVSYVVPPVGGNRKDQEQVYTQEG